MLSLTVAAPAWAAEESATATVAPIGSGGSYLLTLNNNGPEVITNFFVGTGEGPLATNVVPSPACMAGNNPVSDAIKCSASVAPGASTQMCYTDHALEEFVPGALIFFNNSHAVISDSPAVASCPLPGFKSSSPTKCKKGFAKKTVHGKAKCVKRKKHKH